MKCKNAIEELHKEVEIANIEKNEKQEEIIYLNSQIEELQ